MKYFARNLNFEKQDVIIQNAIAQRWHEYEEKIITRKALAYVLDREFGLAMTFCSM